jgi:hypothetical protein
MKLPYRRYALNYVLHLCSLYRRNRLSRAASLTIIHKKIYQPFGPQNTPSFICSRSKS